METNQTIDSIFINKNSLLDTSLDEILIKKDDSGELQIILIFSKFSKESDFKTVRIVFKKIVEYSFAHSSDYNFYNVESYKLIKLEDKIYISLDPDDSTDSRSSEDLDYILSGLATVG